MAKCCSLAARPCAIDFPGLTGTLTCSPNGDCADAKIAVYQVVSAEPDSWNPPDNPRQVWP